MPPTISVHFICRGNVYRSRIAEAYANSLHLTNCTFTSSGIEATQYPDDYLSTWAGAVGKRHNLQGFFSNTRTQTTDDLLKRADIIVFMSEDTWKDAKKQYNFLTEKAVIWHVADRRPGPRITPAKRQQDRAFTRIKTSVDTLVEDIFGHAGWVDIVDAQNQTLGFAMPLPITNRKGLWHRGCHVIISTPNSHVLIQKRSSSIIFSPSMLDVSLGGHVDAGEKPEQAMVREIQEESGLQVAAAQLTLLEVHKWRAYHPRYKCYSNAFIYTYHVQLPENNPQMTIQEAEVAWMKAVSPRQLKRLLTFYRLKHLGRLNYAHAYFNRIARLAGILAE